MIVKIKCVDNSNQDWVTEGKEYDVIDNISLSTLAIIDDHGEICVVDISNAKWEIIE